MENKSAKGEFDVIFEKEDARYKVTLLEKHLMESREEFNRLKEEELALREKQLTLISEMQSNLEQTKKVDAILAESINQKVETIKTEMFAEWQETIKDAVVEKVAELTESKLKEYNKLYEEQNRVIEAQAKKFKHMTMSLRLIRILCYTVCIVAALVFVAVPLGQYIGKDIVKFLEEPSVWGGAVLFSAVLLMILAIALAILLRKREPKQ